MRSLIMFLLNVVLPRSSFVCTVQYALLEFPGLNLPSTQRLNPLEASSKLSEGKENEWGEM